jgi:large subunit ribosomal protein L10
MPTARKEATVGELKELVEKSTIVIGAEYRGLSVKEMTTLRRTLRAAGVDARVVKNRLFQLAANQAGIPNAGQVVEGPTLVVFGYGDVVAPSKAIQEYVRTARNSFAPRRVFMDGEVVAGTMVSELASLPSREELIGRLAGAFISPVQNLASLLADSMQSFARLVEARAAQMEGEAAAGATA